MIGKKAEVVVYVAKLRGGRSIGQVPQVSGGQEGGKRSVLSSVDKSHDQWRKAQLGTARVCDFVRVCACLCVSVWKPVCLSVCLPSCDVHKSRIFGAVKFSFFVLSQRVFLRDPFPK